MKLPKRGCSDCATAIGDAAVLRAELNRLYAEIRRLRRVVRAAVRWTEEKPHRFRSAADERFAVFVARYLKGERRGR